MIPLKMWQTWCEDCHRWRGYVLQGKFSHWCDEWDGLPVDETVREFTACGCFEGYATPEEQEEINRAQAELKAKEAAREANERR